MKRFILVLTTLTIIIQRMKAIVCNSFLLFVLSYGLVVCVEGWAQGARSPYTLKGIGFFTPQTTAVSTGFGGLGTGTYMHRHVNVSNPALLTHASLTQLQMGMAGDARLSETRTESQRSGNVNLSHLHLSVPILRRDYVVSAGLTPYSHVSYAIRSLGEVAGGNQRSVHALRGSGGIYQTYLAQALRLSAVDKNLSLGLKTSLLYGTITRVENITVPTHLSRYYLTQYSNKDTYRQVAFQLGLSYERPLDADTGLTLGAYYEPKVVLQAQHKESFSYRSSLGVLLSQEEDINNFDTTFALPHRLGLGSSYQSENHWLVGLDGHASFWQGEDRTTALRILAGAEWIPDNKSVRYYLLRVPYRVGLSMEKLPHRSLEQDIWGYALHTGFSLPLRNLTSLDLGLKWGLLGTLRQELIRDRYFQFHIGTTFSDQWFVKRRFD